jgi:hypothetical protein
VYSIYIMVSAWILHVKAYQKKHNVSYKEAMSKAKASYKGGAKKDDKKKPVKKDMKEKKMTKKDKKKMEEEKM